MIINRVTFTGADDNTPIEKLKISSNDSIRSTTSSILL